MAAPPECWWLLTATPRLSVPLCGSHLLKWQTGSRDWEQNMWKVSGFHDNWACAFVSILPSNDFDWPVSKYSVKHSCHTASCITPHPATHCTALRESPMRWSVVERNGAWFHSCLFMCTLLELFVYQSSYLSTLAGALRKIGRTVNGISLVLTDGQELLQVP